MRARASLRPLLRRASASSAALRAGRSRLSSGSSTLRQRVPGRGWQKLWLDSSAPLGVLCEGTGPFRRVPPAADGSADGAAPLPSHALALLAEWSYHSLRIALLPRGYPTSVTDNYMSYVQWTALALLTGRIQSVLATQAALFAVGLGAGSIPMAAAVQWVLKDGIGHAGAIIYAARINTRFDADPKRYRFHATCALTVADMVALTMPLFPQYFLQIGAFSSFTSSVANSAHVAARSAVMASMARQNNLADCTRAGQAQSKMMSVLGTALGAALSWLIGPEPLSVIGVVFPLAATSLYASHYSSQLVVLRTVNVQRAERVFGPMLHELPQAEAAGWEPTALAPHEVAALETVGPMSYASVLPGTLRLQPLFRERGGLGAPLRLRAADERSAQWPTLSVAQQLLERPDDEAARAPLNGEGGAPWRALWHDGHDGADGARYALAVGGGATGAQAACQVALWHTSGSKPLDKILAVWHASVLRHRLAGGGGEATREQLAAATRVANAAWPRVHAALEEAGWDLKSVHLDGDGHHLEDPLPDRRPPEGRRAAGEGKAKGS